MVALKKLNMEKEEEGFPITALREIKILKKLKHKNIIELKEVVTEKKPKRHDVYLVFEYMQHDLHGLLDKKIRYEARHIKCLLRQLLEGVAYLHENNVMHRDIKGANLLLNNDGVLKLADFGLSRRFYASRMTYTNRVVTLWYRAPELLLGSTSYTSAIDIWSVGCFFSELLTCEPLFPGDKEPKQYELICQKCGTPSEASWREVTALKNFEEFQPKKPLQPRLR